MKKIAIIGKGLAGLSAADALLQTAGLIDIYYDAPGASHAASGLVHAFVGDTGQKSHLADEALAETFDFFEALGGDFYQKTPFIRKIMHETMRSNFANYPNDIEKLDSEHVLIKHAAKVDVPKYLMRLEQKLSSSGVHFIQKKITDLGQLFFYDKIIIAAGYGIKELFADVKLKFLKGQSLVFHNRHLHNLPLIAKGYLVPFDEYVIIGSTYERAFETPHVDLYRAIGLLEEPLKTHFKPYHEITPLGGLSGVRVAHPNFSTPKLLIKDKVIAITALGSRGLLYHRFMAKMVKSLLEGHQQKHPEFLQYVPL